MLKFMAKVLGVRGLGKKMALKRGALRLLKGPLAALGNPHILGVGNAGAVLAADLNPFWDNGITFSWKSASPFPHRVAVKLAIFHDHAERLDILRHLADALEKQKDIPATAALCPFLALGEISFEEKTWLVEIMPLIEGTLLKSALRKGGVPPETVPHNLTTALNTVLLLEKMGFYTRNLDTENVMVRPDGSWIRIDFDNARRTTMFPPERMIRLSRLCREAIQGTGPMRTGPAADLVKSLKQTEHFFAKAPQQAVAPPHIITTPSALIQSLCSLENYTGKKEPIR
ncbi:MAG TPA: hypothetical protein PLB62_05290 [Candidatus Sumerlaeota bacterium]|nr:hypothetical protein [Candidatus Sumerlaeota bacterium]